MSRTAQLPRGWVALAVGDFRVDRTRSHDPKRTRDEDFDLYSIPAHDEGTVEHLKGQQIGSTKKILEPGTVLVSKINPRISRVAVVGPSRGRRQVGSSEWIPFSPRAEILPDYLAWYLRQEEVRAWLANNVSGVGGSLMRTSSAAVDRLRFPLAPLPEQSRIVEAIESYLSRLDAAVAGLKRAQARLKAYRVSVLKAAVEGRLVPTEAALARAEKRDYEPAEVLLKRTFVERRRRWEKAALAKMIVAGKPPKADKWKVKYVEPESPDAAALPELPEGWCWARVEQLYWDAGYGTSQKCATNADGPAVLRIPNISGGQVTLDDLKYATNAAELRARDRLDVGDFLFIRTNGSKSLIGRGAPIARDYGRPLFFASYLIRLRLLAGVQPQWFATGWHSPLCRSQVLGVAASSAGQHNVSLAAAADVVIPLPPASEQERILDALDEAVSVADEASTEIAATLRRCARLRQSVLRWAFDGRLTDRDPSDEPAEHLLKRIREMKGPSQTRRRTRFARSGTTGQGHAAGG